MVLKRFDVLRNYKDVKLLRLLLLLAPALLSAQSPKVQLMHYRTTSLCDMDGANCLSLFSEVRLLKITAPAAGATAYQIHFITPDRDGSRRTWSYVVPREDRRIGEFRDRILATIFVIPFALDIPILDTWVTALVVSGEPDHQVNPSSHPE